MGKKELDLVIRAIAEVKEITPIGRQLRVDISARNGLESLHPEELELILLKLQDDEKILEIKSPPEYMYRPDTLDLDTTVVLSDIGYPALGQFEIEVLDSWDTWYTNYRARVTTFAKDSLSRQEEKVISETETKYWIQFTSAREILLNNAYQIAKPDFDRENERVFGYLYDHPNAKFTKEQIESELREKLVKPLHKIVENLGFTHALKKAFFSVSQDTIQFRNPINGRDLAPTVAAGLNSLIAKD